MSALAVGGLALGLQVASADTKAGCAPLENPIPVLETHKAAFLNARYQEFFDFAERHVAPPVSADEPMQSSAAKLEQAIPEGFAHCATIMSQRTSKRFVSEFVTYIGAEGQSLYLAWDATKPAEHWRIDRFLISDNFDEIRQAWN